MKKILYRVKEGDTLFSVCNEFGVAPLLVVKDNLLCEEICEGDMLVLEGNGEIYTVDAGETFSSVSRKLGVEEETLRRLNDLPYLFYGLKIRTK